MRDGAIYARRAATPHIDQAQASIEYHGHMVECGEERRFQELKPDSHEFFSRA
jgi:hypothetical protein